MTQLTRRDFNLLLGLGLANLAGRALAQPASISKSKPVLDHLIWIVPDLEEGRRTFQAMTGVGSVLGGITPGRASSHNALASLGNGAYLEIFSPRVAMTSGRWLDLIKKNDKPMLVSYALRVEDRFAALQKNIPRSGLKGSAPREMGRDRPDGIAMRWQLMTVSGSPVDLSLPFFIDWLDTRPHPSEDSPTGVKLQRFELGHPDAAELRRIFKALEIDLPVVEGDKLSFTAYLETPKGNVSLSG